MILQTLYNAKLCLQQVKLHSMLHEVIFQTGNRSQSKQSSPLYVNYKIIIIIMSSLNIMDSQDWNQDRESLSFTEEYPHRDSLTFAKEYPRLQNVLLVENNKNIKKSPIQKSKKSLQLKITEKKLNKLTSYVKVKHDKNALRLIKIKVFDLTASPEAIDDDSRDGDVISAQYIVTNVVDNIMDDTEELVGKISRKLGGSDY